MVYKIAGGFFFILTGAVALGVAGVPSALIGVLALIAGVALLAGF